MAVFNVYGLGGDSARNYVVYADELTVTDNGATASLTARCEGAEPQCVAVIALTGGVVILREDYAAG